MVWANACYQKRGGETWTQRDGETLPLYFLGTLIYARLHGIYLVVHLYPRCYNLWWQNSSSRVCTYALRELFPSTFDSEHKMLIELIQELVTKSPLLTEIHLIMSNSSSSSSSMSLLKCYWYLIWVTTFHKSKTYKSSYRVHIVSNTHNTTRWRIN